ncbi:MAG: F0F1 ATP synthase subunit alpha, partial [Cyanobacteria bacterium]|nr:F0F1 ATP synthase subunit alpha [Cyanobacteriota bacterium]
TKLTEILKQPQYQPLALAEQVSIIFAANQGLLDDVETKDLAKFKEGWFKYLAAQAKDLREKLMTGAKPDEALQNEMKDQVTKFKQNFFKA